MPPPDGRATAPAMNHKARQKRVGKETGDPQTATAGMKQPLLFFMVVKMGLHWGENPAVELTRCNDR